MKQRGRVIQDANSGKGLISSGGKQYEFELAGMWKSDSAPKSGMVVEIELDSVGTISAVYAVSESDLAKEQAVKAMLATKEKGAALYGELSARMGKPTLIAIAALLVSWFYLDVLSINLGGFSGKVSITFWQMLGQVNSGGSVVGGLNGEADKGIYGLLALVALAGPFLSQIWKDSKAYLGYCLPIALMLLIALKIYWGIQDAAEVSLGNNFANELMQNMMKSIMKAVKFGLGAYVAVAASAFLAFVGLKKYFAAKA